MAELFALEDSITSFIYPRNAGRKIPRLEGSLLSSFVKIGLDGNGVCLLIFSDNIQR